jgi:hypothetical protein
MMSLITDIDLFSMTIDVFDKEEEWALFLFFDFNKKIWYNMYIK